MRRRLRDLTAKTCAICTLLIATPARATPPQPDPDPWLGPDKALHFGLSFVLASTAYGLASVHTDARATALGVGGGVSLAAGVGKETADLFGFGDPSWKDLAWDVAGTLAGLAFAWSVDLAGRGVTSSRPLFGAPAPAPPSASRFVLRF